MLQNDAHLREHVKKLIELDNEDSKIDFKRTIDITSRYGKAELIKDITAIANSEPVSDPIGYYIIGVSNKQLFDISHLNIDDATLQQIVNSVSDKPVRFLYKQIKINDVEVGVIVVPKSIERPHVISEDYFDETGRKLLSKGVSYIRKGSSTYVALRDDLDLMYEERISERVATDVSLKRHREWTRAPKGLTERLVDSQTKTEAAILTYEGILREIDLIKKNSEIKSKEQAYYEIIERISVLKRLREADKNIV